MTKEQLESEFEDCHDNNTKATGGGYEADYTEKSGVWRDFSPKIDIYTTHMAISFAEWLNKEGYREYDGAERWIAPHNSTEVFSTQQLYTRFIKSLNNED
mgnify:CR=1 FL=1